MGEVEHKVSSYLKKPEVLADFLNGILYDGSTVIWPEQLENVNRFYDEQLESRDGKRRKVDRERDVLKLLRRDGHLTMIAVENQGSVNYCMPLRTMEYDAVEYARQVRRLRAKYKESRGLKEKEEFLTGIKEEDKLIPTVTFVLYHGEGRWTNRTSLREMLDLSGTDEKLQSGLEDYRLHVINLIDLQEENFQTGLRELIGMMKCRESKRRMQKYCEEHADRFGSMDVDTCELLCTMLNLKTLNWKKEIYKNKEKGTVNMCKAFKDWGEEERNRGRREGKREGIREGREKGKREGKREGIREGRERGKREGTKAEADRFIRLLGYLQRDNRREDIFEVSHNRKALRRLYREYSIEC